MAGTVINGTVKTTVTLASTLYPSPLTVTSYGLVATTAVGAIGIYAPAGAGTLFNYGTIVGGSGGTNSGSSTVGINGGSGVKLLTGVTATNTGTIIGGAGYNAVSNGGAGIYLSAGATFTNDGTIVGGTSDFRGGHEVGPLNHSTAGVGVYLASGGMLINLGMILGGTYFNYGGAGIFMATGCSATIAGVITGGDGAAGVYLANGGFIENDAIVTAGASQSPARGGVGVDLQDGGTLVNVASIFGGASTGPAGSGVLLAHGGTLVNRSIIVGGLGTSWDISGAGAGGIGLSLSPGGVVDNDVAGTIKGGYGAGGVGDASGGVGIYMAGGGVTNAGAIDGGLAGLSGSEISEGGSGVSMVAGAELTNTGLILGAPGAKFNWGFANGDFGGAGVLLGSSATASTIINAGSVSGGNAYPGTLGTDEVLRSFSYFGAGAGAIVATGDTLINTGTVTGGDGISIASDTGLMNLGTIFGGAGISIANGGTLVNDGSVASGIGVYVAPDGTLTNGGTIGGGMYGGVTADAVLFGGAGTLIAYAGYDGATSPTFYGEVVANVSSDDVLELRASDVLGTISDLGTQFVNFAQTTVQGRWRLFAGNTISDMLLNNGELVLEPGTLSAETLTGTGSVLIGFGSTLDVHGAVSVGETLTLGGSGAYLHLYNPSSVSDAQSVGNLRWPMTFRTPSQRQTRVGKPLANRFNLKQSCSSWHTLRSGRLGAASSWHPAACQCASDFPAVIHPVRLLARTGRFRTLRGVAGHRSFDGQVRVASTTTLGVR